VNFELSDEQRAFAETAGAFACEEWLPHAPGWDEFYQEFVRRLANHGYAVICPDLYCREGHGTPDDMAAKVRADGGVADEARDDQAGGTRCQRRLRQLHPGNQDT